MELKELAAKLARRYFMLVTFITAAMMILGLLFDREARFGYDALLLPLLYALCGLVPEIVTWSKKELTAGQMVLRKIIQLAVIEAEVLTIVYFGSEAAKSPAVMISLAAAVLVIYIAVFVTELLMDMSTALKLNSGLNRLQNEERGADI